MTRSVVPGDVAVIDSGETWSMWNHSYEGEAQRVAWLDQDDVLLIIACEGESYAGMVYARCLVRGLLGFVNIKVLRPI